MKWAQVAFVCRCVLKSLRALFWTHVLTAGTMATTLIIFGGFLLVQENLQGLLKGWGGQLQIFAYLADSPASQEVKPLLEKVRALPEVESVRFVSKAEAWESFKGALGGQAGLVDGLHPEILPASLEIVLKKSSGNRSSVDGVAQRLRNVKGVSAVEYPEEWVDKLGLLVLVLEWAKWILGGFLAMATLFIVGNTVKLAILARKDEIEIMQLVGAPQSLIKAPFIIEGMIQGVAAATISLFFLWFLFMVLSSQLPSAVGVFARDHLRFLDAVSILLLVFLGWAMGAAGSLFSLRRFLKTWGSL